MSKRIYPVKITVERVVREVFETKVFSESFSDAQRKARSVVEGNEDREVVLCRVVGREILKNNILEVERTH